LHRIELKEEDQEALYQKWIQGILSILYSKGVISLKDIKMNKGIIGLFVSLWNECKIYQLVDIKMNKLKVEVCIEEFGCQSHYNRLIASFICNFCS
jgi:hypothetical protein